MPLDADYDSMDGVPADVRENKRYKEHGDFTIQGLAERLRADFGETCLDVVVHSLANGPEVNRDLLATSRRGYLGAVGVSAYSMVSMVQRLGPMTRPGGAFVSLTYLASERVIPGYGGGMSSAKAALESDTRVLAWEAGRRWGHRVNCISAGPLGFPSRQRHREGGPGRGRGGSSGGQGQALHREDGRLRPRELAAARGAGRGRSGQYRGVSLLTARELGSPAA